MSPSVNARFPRPGTTQTVSTSATHAETTNVIGSDEVILFATQDCFVVFGAAPVATSSGFFLKAGIYVVMQCDPAEKLSAIRSSADGSLYVTGKL